jgi:hypothetical protein
MEDNTLTTTDEPQVNVEEQVTEEVTESQEQVSDTNTAEDKSAYNDAWDKIDVNDTSILDEQPTTVVNDPLQVEESFEDTSTNNTNNSIGAFMSDKPVLKYKGKEIPVENADELIALAQKGLSLEVRAAELKPKEKALKIIDNVPLEVLQAVADLNSGKTDAINYLKSTYGITDPKPTESNDNFWDEKSDEKPVTNESEYKPTIAQEDPVASFWKDYTASNQVGAAKVNEIYSGLEESFKTEIYTPEIFPAFVQSIESGEFDSVYPLAVKEKSLNPAMTWIQAYQMAVQKGGFNPTTSEPPAAATPPKHADQSRHLSAEAAADRVWNDPEYFRELENKIFG